MLFLNNSVHLRALRQMFQLKVTKRICTLYIVITNNHSWAQQKLSLLSPLNILLTINGPLLS